MYVYGTYITPKSFWYSSIASMLTENDNYVIVVAVGEKFLYVIPVLAIEMQHIQTK